MERGRGAVTGKTVDGREVNTTVSYSLLQYTSGSASLKTKRIRPIH